MPTQPLAARDGRTNTTNAHGADEYPVETDRDDVPTTGRSLVVLDPDTPESSIRAAVGHLDANDGALDLLVVFPTAEYEARRRSRHKAGVTAPYTIDHLEAEARRVAWRAGHEWLAPLGISFEAIGAVGRVRDCVRIVAEERGCARVYVEVPKRTLWQRLLGVADRSTALDDALSRGISVVFVDGPFESGVDVTDAVTDEYPIETDHNAVPTAGRSLVVLDPDAPATSLRAAVRHFSASDEAFDVLVVFPMERFETRREELIDAGATAPYAVSDLEAEARRRAWRAGHEWLTPLGVRFEALGAAGPVRDCVRLVAEERDYARVYIELLRHTRWQRLRGVADRATMPEDALSADVTVVPFDGAVEQGVDVTDTDISGDVVTPDPSIEK